MADAAPLYFVGFGGSNIILTPLAFAPGGVVDTMYGTLSISSGRVITATYFINTSDPDYIALAPGATATEVFYYEATNFAATNLGRVEVQFTKPAASGADVSPSAFVPSDDVTAAHPSGTGLMIAAAHGLHGAAGHGLELIG